MARPRRIKFPGVVYHIPAHSNAKQGISRDSEDRQHFLSVLERVMSHFDLVVHVVLPDGQSLPPGHRNTAG